jgi:ribosomal protein L11 methyltransferase
MQYCQFLFEAIAEDQKDILVALLSAAGFEGFEEEGDSLKAFIKAADLDQQAFDLIMQERNITYSQSFIQEKNWNEIWEAGFSPVEILDPVTLLPFAIVRAGFHAPETRLIHELIVTPKMSFGTGHHATTYLVMERMSQLFFEDRSVIDFGTGTGVLAILAEKMGAAKVLAIDNDDWSINNAKENIRANGCSRISLEKAETIPAPAKAEIVLANINLNVIIDNLPQIKAACEDGADVLFSGIMVADKDMILRALDENFFSIVHSHERNGWLAIETKYQHQ